MFQCTMYSCFFLKVPRSDLARWCLVPPAAQPPGVPFMSDPSNVKPLMPWGCYGIALISCLLLVFIGGNPITRVNQAVENYTSDNLI